MYRVIICFDTNAHARVGSHMIMSMQGINRIIHIKNIEKPVKHILQTTDIIVRKCIEWVTHMHGQITQGSKCILYSSGLAMAMLDILHQRHCIAMSLLCML